MVSIVCGLISSLIFEGSKSVFVSFWKGKLNGVDERMRIYFEKVVDKLVINENIARDLKSKSYSEYLKAVKEKLEETKAYDKNSKLFNDIVEEFSKYVKDDPIFMIQMLWKYQRLIKKQENEIQEELKKVGEKIDAQVRFLNGISKEIENLNFNTPYRIPPIDFNELNNIQYDRLISRDKLVADICNELEKYGCVILYGDIFVGKSSVAKLVGLSKKELNPLLIQLDYKNTSNIRPLIARIEELKSVKLIIIDGLPDYDITVFEDLCNVISGAIKKSYQILITARNIDIYTLERYGFFQHLIPTINLDELKVSFPQCNDDMARLIISTSAGYPMLVNLLLIYLDVNDWSLSEQQIINFISIPNKENVQNYTSKKIREIITDTQDLQLLSRLSLFWRPFTDEDVVALAGVNPVIATPKARLTNLLTQRLLIREEGKLKLSSFIKKIWDIDLVSIEYRDCSNIIIERLINKHTINVLDVNYAVMLLCTAGEYERAGYFYATCLQKCVEVKEWDSSQVYYLTMLWHDMPLPAEMSIGIKTLIRIWQIQLADMTNEDYSYELKDLLDFIDKIQTNPLKSIASCFAIAHLSKIGKINDALSLLPFTQFIITSDYKVEDTELLKEQLDIANNLPVLMLASISDIHNLFQWFDKIEKMNVSVECVNVDAVKFVLNKISINDNTEELLTTIISKVEKNETFQTFLIITVARLMLLFSEKKRFSECVTLFDKYKSLSTIDLGKTMMYHALGCCYNDSGNKDKALELWEKVCFNNSFSTLPDEVMFASINAANIHSHNSRYNQAVRCVEIVVSNNTFTTVLSEEHQMRIRGELAIAYWNNGQKIQAFEQLKIIHNYLFSNSLDTSDQYKLLELKFSICVQQYCYYEENKKFDTKYASPEQTIFYYPNNELLQAYNNLRKGANIIFLYMLAASLKIDEQEAFEIGLHAIECFSSSIKEKHIAFGILNELNPLMLLHNEYDKVEYLTKSTLALATEIKDLNNPLNVVLYYPLLSLCCKRTIDNLTGRSIRIDEIIKSLINEAILLFPNDTEVNALKSCICEEDYDAYFKLKTDLAMISARVFLLEKLDLCTSINVIIVSTMFLNIHKYYSSSLLRQYVYYASKYVISRFESNYRNRYKDPLIELDKVQSTERENLDAAKKMIRALVCFSKESIPLTKEHEDFIGL